MKAKDKKRAKEIIRKAAIDLGGQSQLAEAAPTSR
jgi:precorrin-6B methylase 1